MRASAVTIPAPKPAPELEHRVRCRPGGRSAPGCRRPAGAARARPTAAAAGRRTSTRRPGPGSRRGSAGPGRRPRRRRRPPGRPRRSGTWTSSGPDLLGPVGAEAPALDHGRAAHADRRALGGDDDVAAAEQGGVAGEAPARGDPDQRHQAAQAAEQGERLGVEPGDDGVVGVARPAAPALGEQHHRAAAAARPARTAGPSCGGSAGPGCRPARCSRRRPRRTGPARRRTGRR